MRGRYAGVKMSIYGAILPGAGRLASPEGIGTSRDLGGLEAALLAWNQVYERKRPHQALGYKTPEQFYQDWLKHHSTRKEVLSDMS